MAPISPPSPALAAAATLARIRNYIRRDDQRTENVMVLGQMVELCHIGTQSQEENSVGCPEVGRR